MEIYHPKYKLSPNEIETVIKEEWERRKKMRIVQVRQQAHRNAFDIRNAVKKEKEHQLCNLIEQAENEFEEQKENCLQDLEAQYQQNMDNFGQGHRLAEQQELKKNTREVQMNKNILKANQRHMQAISKLHKEKETKEFKDKKNINRLTALEIEAARAQKVAALPLLTSAVEKKIPAKSPKVQLQDPQGLTTSFYNMPESYVTREDVMMNPEQLAVQHEKHSQQESFPPDLSQERFKTALNKERFNKECRDILQQLNSVTNVNQQQPQPTTSSTLKEYDQKQMEEAFEHLFLDSLTPQRHISDASISQMTESISVENSPVDKSSNKKDGRVLVLNNLLERIYQQREEWMTKTNVDVSELESASVVAATGNIESELSDASPSSVANKISLNTSSTKYLKLPESISHFNSCSKNFSPKIKTLVEESGHSSIVVTPIVESKQDSLKIKQPLMKSTPKKKLYLEEDIFPKQHVKGNENKSDLQETTDQSPSFSNYNQCFEDLCNDKFNTPKPTSNFSFLDEYEVPPIQISIPKRLPDKTELQKVIAYQQTLLQRHKIKQLMKASISPKSPQKNYFPKLNISSESSEIQVGKISSMVECDRDTVSFQDDPNQQIINDSSQNALPQTPVIEHYFNKKEFHHSRPPVTSKKFLENLPLHELSTVIEMDTPRSISNFFEGSTVSSNTSYHSIRLASNYNDNTLQKNSVNEAAGSQNKLLEKYLTDSSSEKISSCDSKKNNFNASDKPLKSDDTIKIKTTSSKNMPSPGAFYIEVNPQSTSHFESSSVVNSENASGNSIYRDNFNNLSQISNLFPKKASSSSMSISEGPLYKPVSSTSRTLNKGSDEDSKDSYNQNYIHSIASKAFPVVPLTIVNTDLKKRDVSELSRGILEESNLTLITSVFDVSCHPLTSSNIREAPITYSDMLGRFGTTKDNESASQSLISFVRHEESIKESLNESSVSFPEHRIIISRSPKQNADITRKTIPSLAANRLAHKKRRSTYQRTLRLYNQLEEVKNKRLQKERVQQYSLYREKAKAFRQKTLESILTKKTTPVAKSGKKSKAVLPTCKLAMKKT